MQKSPPSASVRLACLLLAIAIALPACGTAETPQKLNASGEIADYSGIFQPYFRQWPVGIANAQFTAIGDSSAYVVVSRDYGNSLERFAIDDGESCTVATAEDETVSNTVSVTRSISRVTTVPGGAWYLLATTTQDTGDPLQVKVSTISEMVRISTAGDELARIDISKGLDDSVVNYISADNDSNTVTVGDGKLKAYGQDGALLFTADISATTRLVRSRAGDVYVIQIISHNESYTYTLSQVDFKAKKLGKALDVTDYLAYYMCSGTGNADFYFIGEAGICSLSLETGEVAQVLDFAFHGINRDDVLTISADELGNFYYLDASGATQAIPFAPVYMQSVENIISMGDPGDATTTLPPILAEKKVITFGVAYMFPATRNAITRFNKYSTEYTIKIIDYETMANGDYYKARDLIKLDIANGVGPDIFDITQLGVPRENWPMLALDLYQFFDSDPELGRDDMLPNILSALECNGQLSCITPRFSLRTLVGKQSNLGTELGWSFEDMRALEASLPEGTVLVGDNNKMSLFTSLFTSNYDKFISKDGTQCNFTGDDFIALLEWCNSQPENPQYFINNASYDNITSMLWYFDLELQNDTILLSQACLYNPVDVRLMKEAFAAEVNFIGYPGVGYGASFETSDGLSIATSCQYPEAAWEFIKSTLGAEYGSGQITYGMPTNAVLFEAALQEELLPPTQRSSYFTPPVTRYIGEYIITNPKSAEILSMLQATPLTEKEISQFRDIVYATTTWLYNDSDIWEIIEDSVEPLFSGQKTAPEVAEIIQNRISTMLSERS